MLLIVTEDENKEIMEDVSCNTTTDQCRIVNGDLLLTTMRQFESWLQLNNQNKTLTSTFSNPSNLDIITLQNEYNHVLTYHTSATMIYITCLSCYYQT